MQPAASAAAVSAGPASAIGPQATPAAGGFDLLQLAEAQAGCTETQTAAASTSLQIKLFQVGGKDLICYVSLPNPRPLVPVSFRRAVFSHIHSIAHPGIRATKRMISARYVWRGMAADIAGFCREFLQGLPEVCQRQGDLYGAHADPAYTAAGQAVLPRAHRHSGSSPSLTWR
ncbi:MAG: integrase zinc binding domain-containing protein, partial [bacterium]